MSLYRGPRSPSEGGRDIPRDIYDEVMARDERICQWCGTAATELDHVYPWIQGGSHDPMNLVASCRTCNAIAGMRVFMDFDHKATYVAHRRNEIRREHGLNALAAWEGE